MYKILTVDDESEIVLMIKKYFTMCGYEVITACSGEDAIKKLKYEPDIILLDITMPGLDGLEVCRLIRNEIQCPILLLTARTEIKERVRGFETGADDYIIKPFDMEELHARIDAHIRRENRIQKRKEVIRFYKDMIINYERRQVKINGQEITLSKKEFDIIAELSLNAGRVFSREKIYENIWGFDKNGNNETVIEHIRRIRMKLSEVSDYEYIKTVWGMWLYLEFIKRMSIKRAFFLLTVICLLIGGSLGCIGFWGLGLLNQERDISIKMENDTFTYEYQQENTHDLERNSSGIITFLQVVFLVFCIICSIIVADIIFYYKKIKKPVENLLVGANKINNSDLNFSIKSESSDELGKLCIVFEKMRITMQKTIESLWRVAEERKRLNAAFSHDLRNSLTILKGEMAVVQKGISSGLMNDEEILEVFSGVDVTIKRLEKYIAIMSSITDLEAVPCSPQVVNIQTLKRNLESHVQLLVKDTTIKIIFDVVISEKEILILDQDIFYNIIDNIIENALRYAKTQICLKIRIEEDFLHMSIQDDGVGFSDYIIKKGREAFIRDGEKNGAHFGMGLYICRLFCEKHGGAFHISNNDMGALNEVFINIKEFE